MGVDQAWQHDMGAGLEDRRIRRDGCASCADKLHDAAFLHNQASLGFIGKNGQGILDPERSLLAHLLSFRRSR